MSYHNSRSSYRPSNYPRKRVYHENLSYGVPNKHFLSIENVNPVTYENQVEDSKVLNSIKRFNAKNKPEVSKRNSNISMIVAEIEANYFEENFQKYLDELRESFQISDLIISRESYNIADKLITVYGDIESVSKAALYITFVLNSKLNNVINSDLYTLKSGNYSAYFLTQLDKLSLALQSSGIYNFDVAHGFSGLESFHVILVKSDFNSIFNFLVHLQENTKESDHDYINDLKDVHTVSLDRNASGLYKQPEDRKQNFQTQAKKALRYVYPESFSTS